MSLKTFNCPFCKNAMGGEDLARNTIAYSPDTHLHVTLCPHCGKNMEYRASSGALELGYTYWAGSMHFEGVVKLPLLGFKPADGGALDLNGERIFAPPAT